MDYDDTIDTLSTMHDTLQTIASDDAAAANMLARLIYLQAGGDGKRFARLLRSIESEAFNMDMLAMSNVSHHVRIGDRIEIVVDDEPFYVTVVSVSDDVIVWEWQEDTTSWANPSSGADVARDIASALPLPCPASRLGGHDADFPFARWFFKS